MAAKGFPSIDSVYNVLYLKLLTTDRRWEQ